MSIPSALAARQVPALTAGSAPWLQTISASKISAILGTSAYDSPVSLFHKMKGNVESSPGNKTTERGTFLEDSVLAWFASKHPELAVYPGASFAHPNHPHWTAAPDSIAVDPLGGTAYGVEAKTSQFIDEWGDEGTWQVPPYYLAQAVWQMIVCGFKTVFFPVLFGMPFEFRLYIVRYEDVAHEIDTILAEVAQFEQYLEADIVPEFDGADATYQTIRKLHPLIDGSKQELTLDTAARYVTASQAAKDAEEAFTLAKSLLADEMGNAKTAVYGPHTIATRQARGQGTPFLVIGKNLPHLEMKAA